MKDNESQNDGKNADADFNGSSPAELLTDSLLRNHAANPDGAEDVAFLDKVEAAIDSNWEPGEENSIHEAAEFPRPERMGWQRIRWAGGIAALLMVGVGALMFLKTQLAQNEHYAAHSYLDNLPASQSAKYPGPLSAGRPEKPTPVIDDASATDSWIQKDSDPRVLADSIPVIRSGATPFREAAAASESRFIAVNGSSIPPVGSVEAALGGADSQNALAYSQEESRDARRDSYTGRTPVSYQPTSLSKRNATASGSATPVRNQNTGPRYGQLVDNRWKTPFREPLSTFSIDVDTASWTNIRGMLDRGLPPNEIPSDAVRIEEMINYFDWKYPQPNADHPFGFAIESASCPWNEDNRLLRIAIQGKDVKPAKRPPANLVFLLDVSGSMRNPDKLPLVQRAISILIEELNREDRVSIVVYAGSEGVALNSTPGNQQAEILDALNRLHAGGSTNGGAGIGLAYKLAAENFNPEGINRVILCTDGDFNVGTTGTESLVDLVERKAKRDRVFLSVCGFGDDNLNDAMLEAITNKGNGTYYYIDNFAEARKVFLKDLMGTLVTIAKDVKIQVEFNPGQVKAYRLIGYANRQLEAKDFEDDRVDAGEIGAGHSVTAFYEIVPAGAEDDPTETTSNLRYQKEVAPEPPPQPKRKVVPNPELALLKLRYKKPDEDKSNYVQQPVMPNDGKWRKASADFRFASAVAMFGLKLRNHEDARGVEYADIIAIARNAIGNDPHGYRAEFVKLLEQAQE